MQQLHFENSRNGMRTCRAGTVYLHSRYDPQKEADRYIESLRIPFVPKYIVIFEPALSYCAGSLKTAYPGIRLCAVRLSESFQQSNAKWDYVFTYTQGNKETLAEHFFSYMGETGLSAAFFAEWPPAAAIWPERCADAWEAAKLAVLKSRDVLATRSYFSRKWYSNIIRFCMRLERAVLPETGSMPVLFAASGPSLKDSLPFIKTYRKDFFLLAASSAYPPLSYAGITPDACITADGGFWAKKHIGRCGVPVLVPAEAAVPGSGFKNCPVAPLVYKDGGDVFFLNACNIRGAHVNRNGTVSGIAIDFALRLTDGYVYACGLDLAPVPGFQHTQPNELETSDSLSDFRLVPAAQRAAARELNAGSLHIYRRWFISHASEFKDRFIRLYGKKPYIPLANIPDMSWQSYAAHRKQQSAGCSPSFHQTAVIPRRERRAALTNLLADIEKSIAKPDTEKAAFWLSELVPAEYLSYDRSLHKKEAEHDLIGKARKILKYLAERVDKEYAGAGN